MKKTISLLVICIAFNLSCSIEKSALNQELEQETDDTQPVINPSSTRDVYKILALGDSYTIGESVCKSCRYPEQLKDSLKQEFNAKFKLKIIAQTGWTTSNLIHAIESEKPSKDYDLVTLLIGVNNQYQGNPFNDYKNEFIDLVNRATEFAKGNKADVIVVSIPDYAYTPFGNGNRNISAAIDKYNEFAMKHCNLNNITYINITDITRKGLEDSNLVAQDGLHPSKLAYTKFVNRILPHAIEKLKN